MSVPELDHWFATGGGGYCHSAVKVSVQQLDKTEGPDGVPSEWARCLMGCGDGDGDQDTDAAVRTRTGMGIGLGCGPGT